MHLFASSWFSQYTLDTLVNKWYGNKKTKSVATSSEKVNLATTTNSSADKWVLALQILHILQFKFLENIIYSSSWNLLHEQKKNIDKCSLLPAAAAHNNKRLCKSTRELLRRKNMDLLDYNCILCNGSTEESLLHLFLGCPFATQCWAWFNIQVDHNSDPFQNLQGFKEQLGVPFFTGHHFNVPDHLEGKKW